MKTTYNTGKVQIGKYYEPPRHFESSLDMDRLQVALIQPRQKTPVTKSALMYAAAILATGLVALLG